MHAKTFICNMFALLRIIVTWMDVFASHRLGRAIGGSREDSGSRQRLGYRRSTSALSLWERVEGDCGRDGEDRAVSLGIPPLYLFTPTAIHYFDSLWTSSAE
jgi:hypothetical protein